MTDMTFIDTHCHLTDKAFEDDFRETLNRAVLAGVEHFVLIGSGDEMTGNDKVISLCQKYENMFASLGIHPHDAKISNSQNLESLKKLKNEKVLAWGEIGLDYHYMNSEKELQIRAFIDQIHLAFELDLPIVIHTREAELDTLSTLKEYKDKIHKMVIHCFTGDSHFSEELKPLGAYLGIGGILTFKNAEPIRKAIKDYPMDRLLLETDSPYLAPDPHRGKRNEPSFLPHIAHKLAELKSHSVDEIARVTSQNAKDFFKLP